MTRAGIDAALILSRTATQWLTGFRGTASQTLILPSRAILITDSRYIEAARAEIRGVRVLLQRLPLEEQIAAILRRHHVRRLGLESTITHRQWLWAKRLAPRGTRVTDVSAALERLRAVKDPQEIAIIRRAVSRTDDIFEDLLPWLRRRLARRPVTEIEIARHIKSRIEEHGGEGPSFPPIVAAAANSARPHAVPGRRRIRRGHSLLFDFGMVFDGLCSDMTRTVVVGKPTAKHRGIYDIVREAQEAGLAALRAGVRGRDVDAAARDVIRRAGFAKHFGHGLGHGVGIEIHEQPRLTQTAKTRLSEGNVVTVEPGIYLPGFGGVRIEDMAVVRRDGCDVLTRSPKDLICL
jgi:Xaa-Pro aminopeptidase